MQKKKRKKKSNKKSNNLLYILILVLVLAAGGFTYFKFFKTSSGSGNTNATVQSNNDYVVSTSNETATKIGEEVLAKGGNAVDAAIAVSYALGVAQPYASGIGGGGGMLIYDPSSTDYKFYDYKDAAPVSATTKQSDIAVPGFVLGMEKISNDLGTMDISDLIQYSVDLARDGVEVNSDTVKAINSFASLLQNDEDYVKEDGSLLAAGDKLVQSELANTLKTIQEKGSAGFYSGEIGQNIANAAKMQLSDLSAYKVKEEKPTAPKKEKPKAKNKPKFSYNEQREFDTIDEDIEKLEDKIASLEEDTSKYATDFTKLQEIMDEKTKLENELQVKYERWEYLNNLAEEIANWSNN